MHLYDWPKLRDERLCQVCGKPVDGPVNIKVHPGECRRVWVAERMRRAAQRRKREKKSRSGTAATQDQ